MQKKKICVKQYCEPLRVMLYMRFEFSSLVFPEAEYWMLDVMPQ